MEEVIIDGCGVCYNSGDDIARRSEIMSIIDDMQAKLSKLDKVWPRCMHSYIDIDICVWIFDYSYHIYRAPIKLFEQN